ncbi:MAG: integrase core domain-containing protein, partial [Terrimesophilobacter sp.]
MERFQQTLKKWLRARSPQPGTITELQTLLDEFADEDNHRRPHRSLPHQATPAALYTSMPKATPTGSRDNDTHNRVRHDRVDDSGVVTLRINSKMHHIGIGRVHARTRVLVLVHDRDIRIINPDTGELL